MSLVALPSTLANDILRFRTVHGLENSALRKLADNNISGESIRRIVVGLSTRIITSKLRHIRRVLRMSEDEIKAKLNGTAPPKRTHVLPAGLAPADPYTRAEPIEKVAVSRTSRTTIDLQTRLDNNFRQLGEKDQRLLAVISARLARSARILRSATEMDEDI
jgi:hypothetical protein